MKKVMFITAHPHYAMYYCAGTIINHVKAGDEVSVLSLTGGELVTDRYPMDQLKRMNTEEAENAGRLLGVSTIKVLDLGDTKISNNEEARLAVNDQIRQWKPNIVITHWPQDTHPDYRETAKTVIDTSFFAILLQGKWAEKYPPHSIDRMYGFEIPMLSLQFEGSHFIDISDSLECKRKAMECFKIQIECVCGGDVEKWTSASLAPNRRWGLESGCAYAEPYAQLDIQEIHKKAQKTLA